MDIEFKLASLHLVTALIAGYLSFIISTGAIGAIGKMKFWPFTGPGDSHNR